MKIYQDNSIATGIKLEVFCIIPKSSKIPYNSGYSSFKSMRQSVAFYKHLHCPLC